MHKNNPRHSYLICGAGCFWGVEERFRVIPGVLGTEVGYAGGHEKNTTYERVSTGTTGHAEVVRVQYDQSITSYEDLLRIFWKMHDPTTPNRQGPDVGTQYRSVVLYETPEQKEIAENVKKELEDEALFEKPIVTEIAPLTFFVRAEEYHQKYVMKNGGSVCNI